MITSANMVMHGTYDYSQVAGSVLIAIAASYVALDLAGRVTAARGKARIAWLAGGAAAMGVGIFEMHLKGILAFRLPVPVAYQWPTLLASLLISISASAVALYVTSRQKMGWPEALTGSLVMGSGIAGLHYTAMAAMRLPAITQYSPVLVICSILLAVLFSLIALLLAFDLREETRWTVPRRTGSAVLMGMAVSAMHYTAVAAATFIPSSPPDLVHTVNISPLGNSGIAVITLIGMFAAIVTSSVDKRGQAEILGKQKEIFQKIFEHIPATLAFVEKDGNVVLVNPAWERTLGWTLDEIRQNNIDVLAEIFPDPKYRQIVQDHVAASSGQWVDLKVRVRNGKVIDAAVAFLHLSDGTSLVIGQDITERKRAEQTLRESQAELARVTRAVTIGELTTTIAHEINQPLTAVVTDVSASLRWLAQEPPNLDEARTALVVAIREANRASDVISRIRALLRNTPPPMQRLNIREIIDEVLTIAHGELHSHGISVRTDLAADTPKVLGDRIQLQQLLLNLVMNSIDAMSMIIDRPRQLLIKGAPHSEGVLVQVQDTGIGLDPAQLDRIFEPFFTTKPRGFGMGLSISRSIVEAHSGRLWAVPNSPYGAVFQFTLQRAESQSERAA